MNKKQPTKEQWAEIEKKLDSVFGCVKLRIDGYEITLMVQRIEKMKLAIAIYVNGFLGTERVTEETEINRRFNAPHRKYVFSAKYRKSVKRLSKVRREACCSGWDKQVVYYWPWWTSFRALKAHLVRNNESIEVIGEADTENCNAG